MLKLDHRELRNSKGHKMGLSAHCRVILCKLTSDLDSWDWVLSKIVLTCSNRTTGGWELAKESFRGWWVVVGGMKQPPRMKKGLINLFNGTSATWIRWHWLTCSRRDWTRCCRSWWESHRAEEPGAHSQPEPQADTPLGAAGLPWRGSEEGSLL